MGNVELALQVAGRVEQHGDDAHRLLRIVEAVAERVSAGRDQVQAAEGPLRTARRRPDTKPAGDAA